MIIMPELAVALRRELTETLTRHEAEVIRHSTWLKTRPGRAEASVATLRHALQTTLPIVLWQKGVWAEATASRDVIGGELTNEDDMEPLGQLWLFDAITIPAAVKKRFDLPSDARVAGRILLPIHGEPDATKRHEVPPLPDGQLPQLGVMMGYLFRTHENAPNRDGIPFLRLLPDLYPGEFIVDPHINFVAANRYLKAHRKLVRAFSRSEVYTVGPENI